jgi:hypothetical protein
VNEGLLLGGRGFFQLLPGYSLANTEVLALYPSRRHLTAKVRVMIDS